MAEAEPERAIPVPGGVVYKEDEAAIRSTDLDTHFNSTPGKIEDIRLSEDLVEFLKSRNEVRRIFRHCV